MNSGSSPYNIIFYGTPEFSVPCLETLIKSPSYNVVAVVTQPDRPAGRGKKLTGSAVKQVAEKQRIKVIQPESIKKNTASFLAELDQLPQVDVAIVIAFGQILPIEVLNYPKFNSVNLHASLLPRWRGAAPIQRAIEAGDSETGVCLMGMEAGLDTGPVFSKRSIQLKDQNAKELHDELAELSATIISEDLNKYLKGELTPKAQDNQLVTHAKKLTKEEEAINWELSSTKLIQKIRAFAPFPGLYTDIKARRIKIIDAQVENLENLDKNYQPGEVIFVDKNSLIVATGSGTVSLKSVKPSGKQLMDINSFMSGFKINCGDVFQ